MAQWFPKKERAFATGLFNAGTNIGAIVTPLVIPAITLAGGWRGGLRGHGPRRPALAADLVAGLPRPGQASARQPRRARLIQSDPPDAVTKVRWGDILSKRETWAYALGKFLIDPIWWMFLFWLPDFLGKRHGLDLTSFGPPLVAIYLLSDVGSVARRLAVLAPDEGAAGASTARARPPC